MNLDFYKNKKVLVTGHTGFKGAWLSLWLLHLGAEVIGYSLEETDNTELFDALDLKNKLVHYNADINNLEKLKEVFNTHKPEIVFHLAAQAIVKTSYDFPIETFETNVIGTLKVMEAIRICPSVKAGIMITSDKCYKNEEQKKSFVESDPMGGNDPYSASKACAELAITSFRNSFFSKSESNPNPTKIVAVRSGNILGGGDFSKDRIVVDCIKAIQENRNIVLRDPKAVRPWQHVMDATYAYLLVGKYAFENTNPLQAFNIGPDDETTTTVEDLVKKIIQNFGQGTYSANPTKIFHEAHFLTLNVSLINATLGWKCKYNADELIKITTEWYKEYFSANKTNASEITIAQIENYMKN